MKLAIVHDALVNLGGAERVLGSFHLMFPDAPIYTTVYLPDRTHDILQHAKITSTWLQNIVGSEGQLKALFPLTYLAMRKLPLSTFDVVLSSSTYCAKNVDTVAPAIHICYCYAPFRPVWDFDQYTARVGWSWVKRQLMRWFFSAFRRVDFNAGQKPDYLVAISKHAAAKIERAYGRRPDAIIYPPVDVTSYSSSEKAEDFFLVVSRLVAYKKIDLVIRAFTQLKMPLKIVGTGPDLQRLKAIADHNVEFVGAVSELELRDYYARCRALIFPGIEDFGLTPIEAHASGKPVIALSRGGALETVIDASTVESRSATGLFFRQETSDAIVKAIRQFDHMTFDSTCIRNRARIFDITQFRARFCNFVSDVCQGTLQPERWDSTYTTHPVRV